MASSFVARTGMEMISTAHDLVAECLTYERRGVTRDDLLAKRVAVEAGTIHLHVAGTTWGAKGVAGVPWPMGMTTGTLHTAGPGAFRKRLAANQRRGVRCMAARASSRTVWHSR